MNWTEIIRPEKLKQLILNYETQLPLKGSSNERDFMPVVRLFNPIGAATFLITECDRDGLAFGLADLGFGSPELGYISLEEMSEVVLPGNLRIEEDLYWTATKTLSQYATLARQLGRIP